MKVRFHFSFTTISNGRALSSSSFDRQKIAFYRVIRP